MINPVNSLKSNLILLLAGVVAAAIGTFFTVSGRKQAARDTEPATATVIEYVEGTEHSSVTDTEDTVYYPVVSFEAAGETVESQYSQSDSSPKYQIGDKIEIKYNPGNPEEFIIAGDSRIESGAIWVAPAGILMILIALGRISMPFLAARKKP